MMGWGRCKVDIKIRRVVGYNIMMLCGRRHSTYYYVHQYITGRAVKGVKGRRGNQLLFSEFAMRHDLPTTFGILDSFDLRHVLFVFF